MKQANDFTKFLLFVKGVIESGLVIKYGTRVLTQEVKMHFNRLLHDATEFEKFLHQSLGKELAEHEDDINSSIISLVWQIFDLSPEERERFIDYINKF